MAHAVEILKSLPSLATLIYTLVLPNYRLSNYDSIFIYARESGQLEVWLLFCSPKSVLEQDIEPYIFPGSLMSSLNGRKSSRRKQSRFHLLRCLNFRFKLIEVHHRSGVCSLKALETHAALVSLHCGSLSLE